MECPVPIIVEKRKIVLQIISDKVRGRLVLLLGPIEVFREFKMFSNKYERSKNCHEL